MSNRLNEIERRITALEDRYPQLVELITRCIDKIGALEKELEEHRNAPHGRKRA